MTNISLQEPPKEALKEPPKETPAKLARHRASAAKIVREQSRVHIQQLAGKMLDGLGQVLDAIPKALDDKPSRATVRRQTANLLGLPRLCANSTCKRARSCRGEPLHCLRTTLFLLPPEIIESLALTPRRKPARRRKRANVSLHG